MSENLPTYDVFKNVILLHTRLANIYAQLQETVVPLEETLLLS
jgi:hypothetical protein